MRTAARRLTDADGNGPPGLRRASAPQEVPVRLAAGGGSPGIRRTAEIVQPPIRPGNGVPPGTVPRAVANESRPPCRLLRPWSSAGPEGTDPSGRTTTRPTARGGPARLGTCSPDLGCV